MMTALLILDHFTIATYQIRSALDDGRWRAFAARLKPHASAFQGLTAESELERTAIMASAPFLADALTSACLQEAQRGVATQLPEHRGRLPSEVLAGATIPEIAAAFYALYHDPDAALAPKGSSA